MNNQGLTRCWLFTTTNMGVWPWPPRITRNSIPRTREEDNRAGGNRARNRAGGIPGRRGALGRSPSLRDALKAGQSRGPENAGVRRRGLPSLEGELAARIRAAALRTPVRAAVPAVSRSGPGGLTRFLPGADMTARAADLPAAPGRLADRAGGPADDPTVSLCPQGPGPTIFPAGCGMRSA